MNPQELEKSEEKSKHKYDEFEYILKDNLEIENDLSEKSGICALMYFTMILNNKN